MANENEALELGLKEPTYMSSVEIKPQWTSSAGHIYLNKIMISFYEDGNAEETLT